MRDDLPPRLETTGPRFEDRLFAPVTAAADGKSGVTRLRRRQRTTWLLLTAGLLLLLSIFSSGFFLFAVLVVLGVWAVSALWPAASLGALAVRRELSQDVCEIGEVVDAELTLTNRKSWPAWWLFWREQAEGLDIEGADRAFSSLGAGAAQTLEVRLHPVRRGLFRVGPAIVEASGPFGLLQRYWLDGEARFLTVLPRSVAIGQSWPLGHRPVHEVPRRHSLFEDPSRFLGIRQYRRGDSRRRIHWRASARSRELQVKLFEPSVLEGVLLAVEMGEGSYPGSASELGDPLLELAITTAASLAEYVLAGDQRVGLLANGADAAEAYAGDWTGSRFRQLDEALDEAASRRKVAGFRPLEVPPGKGAWQRDRLRSALARLVTAPGPGLAEVLDLELPRLPRSLVLAILTPRLDAALAATVGSLRRSGIEVALIRIGGGDLDGFALPPGVPLYGIARESDIEQLGSRRL